MLNVDCSVFNIQPPTSNIQHHLVYTFCRKIQLVPLTKTISKIVLLWVLLALLNYLLIITGLVTETPLYFPISVFRLEFHLSGMPYALAFALVLWTTLHFLRHLNALHLWVVGLCLILSGNLMQGSPEQAFYQPFQGSELQYYYDAVQITDWQDWLRTFHKKQPYLLDHTRSHPPFAVLLHHLFLSVSGGSVAVLAGAFILFSSLAVPFVWHILKNFDIPLKTRRLLTLLFTVLPAVNIYSAVCLDGVILTCSTLFLLGLSIFFKDGPGKKSFFWLALGTLLMNMLTFGGLFLFGVLILLSLRQIVMKQNFAMLFAAGTLASVLGFFGWLADDVLGYNHIRSFFTASLLENPEGFRGLSEPVNYVMTRIENISELALFLSFGCVAVLWRKNMARMSLCEYQNDPIMTTYAGIAALFLMFLAGAFYTGETARACLFLYPYLLFLFQRIEHNMLQCLIVLAGLQCIVMQLCGWYFW